jgi:hypothetical protein
VKPPENMTLPLLHDIGCFRDADNDGLADGSDPCVHSDLSASVAIGGCQTGITNTLFANRCTIKDFVDQAAGAAGNHGNFVSAIAHLGDGLNSAALISGSQKGKRQSCAAGAAIPQADPVWCKQGRGVLHGPLFPVNRHTETVVMRVD